jgi:small subunit ribosomal protein S16
MLVIRFQRIGKKHQPSYRIVVSEKREKLGAPPAEDLGSYDPKTKKVTLNKERAQYWLQKGATPSATVHNLLIKEGVISAAKIQFNFPVNKPQETVEVAATPAAEATVEAKPEEPAAPREEAPQS